MLIVPSDRERSERNAERIAHDSCQTTELFLELTHYVVTLSRTIREAR